jgi:hypothetical protein
MMGSLISFWDDTCIISRDGGSFHPFSGSFRGYFSGIEKVSLTLTLFVEIHNRDSVILKVLGGDPHSGDLSVAESSVIDAEKSARRASVFQEDALASVTAQKRQGFDFSAFEKRSDVFADLIQNPSVGLDFRGDSRGRQSPERFRAYREDLAAAEARNQFRIQIGGAVIAAIKPQKAGADGDFSVHRISPLKSKKDFVGLF